MKKSIINIIIIITINIAIGIIGIMNYVNANFQDGLYCSIQTETLVVSLKKTTNNTLCNDYIHYLQANIFKEYKNIQQIEKFIKYKKNTEFWSELKQQKLKTIAQFNLLKKKIQHHTDIFETNLIEKIQKYIRPKMKEEQEKLLNIYTNIKKYSFYDKINSKSIETQTRKAYLCVNQILQAKKIDVMLKKRIEYIYLKKEIEGK